MDSLYTITTPRLRLYAPSHKEVRALRNGDFATVNASVGAVASPEWLRGPSMMRFVPHLPEAMEQEPGDSRWLWLIIEPISATVVGDIGFHSPLRAHETVEIGYSVIPRVRGFGYTTEVGKALLAWTFVNTQVAEVIAQIEPGNAASLRVAAKLGMHEIPQQTIGHCCFSVQRSVATSLAGDSDRG